MPQVDLNQPVEQYFDFVQRTVDLNRELATKWAQWVNTLSGAARETGRIVQPHREGTKQTPWPAWPPNRPRKPSRSPATRPNGPSRPSVSRSGKPKKPKRPRPAKPSALSGRSPQGAGKAREAYEGLTKADLSDQLAERGLPKTGNVDDLIDRLVEADNNN